MGPEQQNIIEDSRDSMKDLHIDVAISQGAKIHEVQEGDTLWDIVKTEYGFTNDSEVANSIIKISKVNMMNNTIKKDSLSVIDGKVVNSPDGIPGDLIFAGETIIIEMQTKGLSKTIKKAEIEDIDNELPDIDSMLEIEEAGWVKQKEKLKVQETTISSRNGINELSGITLEEYYDEHRKAPNSKKLEDFIIGFQDDKSEGTNPNDYEDIPETSSGEEDGTGTEGAGSGSGGASGGIDGGSIGDLPESTSSPISTPLSESKSKKSSILSGLGFINRKKK